MKLVETKVIEQAASLELKLARQRIAELDALLAAKATQPPARFTRTTEVVRSLALSTFVVVTLSAIAHRLIMWSWPQ